MGVDSAFGHFVSSIAQCETQQWPILEPSPNDGITLDFSLNTQMSGLQDFETHRPSIF